MATVLNTKRRPASKPKSKAAVRAAERPEAVHNSSLAAKAIQAQLELAEILKAVLGQLTEIRAALPLRAISGKLEIGEETATGKNADYIATDAAGLSSAIGDNLFASHNLLDALFERLGHVPAGRLANEAQQKMVDSFADGSVLRGLSVGSLSSAALLEKLGRLTDMIGHPQR